MVDIVLDLTLPDIDVLSVIDRTTVRLAAHLLGRSVTSHPEGRSEPQERAHRGPVQELEEVRARHGE
ncbi:hypothetical protein [Streptomyces sp. NPDC046859]|uniref:hypothetical protein n=1 Tax=Streptomyces sp. NPDC046859 TaxID=3155734 RepID=UPI0033F615A6